MGAILFFLYTHVVVVLPICVVAIEAVLSALSVDLHDIAVFPSVEVCQDCRSCGIRFNNDFSSHSSCRWIWPCARHIIFRPCWVPQYGQLLFLSVNGTHVNDVIMLHSSQLRHMHGRCVMRSANIYGFL